MANLNALRESVQAQPANPHAVATLNLIDWSLDAADLLRTVLPMCERGSVIHNQITELLVGWAKANER